MDVYKSEYGAHSRQDTAAFSEAPREHDSLLHSHKRFDMLFLGAFPLSSVQLSAYEGKREGLDNIVCIQKLTERRSGILRPLIGMEDQSVGNVSALICFMEGSDNQGGIVFGG